MNKLVILGGGAAVILLLSHRRQTMASPYANVIGNGTSSSPFIVGSHDVSIDRSVIPGLRTSYAPAVSGGGGGGFDGAKAAKSALSVGVTGAGIGTAIVPGIGTIIGGGIGAAVGFVGSLF